MRRRWVAMLPLVFVVATGTAGAAVAMSTADRTSRAYGEYLERAAVADVVINPGASTLEIDRVIRNLSGVERVTSDTVFAATLDDGEPRTRREVAQSTFDLTVRGRRTASTWRWTDQTSPWGGCRPGDTRR